MILYNLLDKDKEDIHWVAALEIFFERNLNPEIASDRIG
jgi:hypothetical protein